MADKMQSGNMTPMKHDILYHSVSYTQVQRDSNYQRVPESMIDPELVSRSQYYEDFFTDHQHINHNDSVRCDFDDEEIPFPRVIEGREDTSDSSINSTEDEDQRKPRQSRKKGLKYVKPCASSTVIEESGISDLQNKNENRNPNFRPKLCSTLLDISMNLESRQPVSEQNNSSEDGFSVFTWSIYDKSRSASSLEEWDISAINQHDLIVKPPTVPRKARHSTKPKNGPKPVRQSKVFNQDSVFLIDDLHNDEDFCLATKRLPRTSTKADVNDSKSDSFHKVPECIRPIRKQDDKSCSRHHHSDESMNSISINRRSVIKKFMKFNKSLRSQDTSSLKTLVSL